MSILDEYNQDLPDDISDESRATTVNPADLRRKKAEIERNIVIAQSDLGKIIRKKQALETEKRKLKKNEERIRVEQDALDEKLKKMQDDQRLLEEEIKSLKKKLKIVQ